MKAHLPIAFAALLAPLLTYSGDYTLTVSDDANAPCTKHAHERQAWCTQERAKGKDCRIELSWPIHTAAEVIESLDLFFAGREPTIPLLVPAFSNGHLTFCSAVERCNVYRRLRSLEESGTVRNKKQLANFVAILGVKSGQCLQDNP